MQLDKKVIFFTAASVPTAAELVQIDALKQIYGKVAVRNGDVNVNSKYGAAGESAGRLEEADAIAGSTPAAYDTAIADYTDGDVTPDDSDDSADAITVAPATASIAANGGTVQLQAVCAEVNANGTVTQTIRNSGTGISWSSGTPGKATVSSSGLVTGANAGAGSTVITYTYDPTGDGDAKTGTATITVT